MAYSAVISLKYTIEYLEISKLTRSAHEELEDLGHILKRLDSSSNTCIDRSKINALDAKIREAVYKFEDFLLSRQVLEENGGLVREIRSFSETVQKLKEEYSKTLDDPLPLQQQHGTAAPIPDFDGEKSTAVRLRDQFERIRDELLDPQSETRVVSLVGMAGIGKSHLAREIYHDPVVGERFEFRVWLSVGPQQQFRNVWTEIVAQIEGVPRNAHMETNIITLVGLLQKKLRGHGRCLIVLDDVWSTKVCETLIRYLRADGDGRRIVLTTRLEEVAKHQGTSVHQIRFLDNEESWKLLQLNVFGEEYFPHELEEAGKKIAENCEGLPLWILAVAEILRGLEKTKEYWNKVADSKTTTFLDAYERISKVLYSSYEYLPQYLKACFLYMGVFPQKSQIPLPKLLHLWIVEDVLEPQEYLIRTKKKDPHFMERDWFTFGSARPSRYSFSKSGVRRNPYMSSVEINPFSNISPAFMERDRFTSGSARPSKGHNSRTCSGGAMKPLERLYLVEPGPSPVQFIKRWEKIESRDSRFHKKPLRRGTDRSGPKVKTTPKGIAMEYLKKLVSHSLAIVCRRSSTSKIKSCKLHSTYWYLCVEEARKNKFFHVLKKLTDAPTDYTESHRRLSVQTNMLFGIKEVYDSMAATSTARSLLYTGPDQEYPVPICLNSMLIKVLDAVAIRLYSFPTEVVKLLELRYLALTHNGKPPSSISNLQQLEYLIIRRHHSIEFLRCSTPLPTDMRIMIQAMRPWWNRDVLDPTCLVKDIWEKICDVQEVWSSRLQANSTCLTEEIWMNIWELIWDMQQVRRTQLMRENILCSSQLVWDMKKLWSNELLRDFNCFPEKIWVDIWRKMWNILQAWKSKLPRDPIGLLKEIWEEIWDLKQGKSTKLLSDSTFLPKEIWAMKELRYLRIKGRNLPDPSFDTQLPYLWTLHVNARSCTYNVFKSIPSLKKLGIQIELQPEAAETSSCFKYIWLLKGLKSLKCVVVNPWLRSQAVGPPHHLSNFPKSLKKLSLNGLGYSWQYMHVIGLLPELEVLKLRCSAFQGPEWETGDEEFSRLKYLLLEDIDLVRWSVASDYCFPSLHCLIIRHCYKLKKLPGVIASLNTIEVVDCSPSVVKQIHQDRKGCVGDVITSSWSLRR